MSIEVTGFSCLNQVREDLVNVTDETQISLCQIGDKEVSIGRHDRGQAVRSKLLESLDNTFGENGIPESVQKAMNVGKAFSGFRVKNGVIQATNHPLTARRLRAIINAVEVALAGAERGRLMQARASVPADDVNDRGGEGLELGKKLGQSDLDKVATGIKNYNDAVTAGKVDNETQELINAMTERQQALFKGVFGESFRFGGKDGISKVVKQYALRASKIERFCAAKKKLPNYSDLLETGKYEPKGPLPF